MRIEIVSSRHGKFEAEYDDEDDVILGKHRWWVGIQRSGKAYTRTKVRIMGKTKTVSMLNLLMPNTIGTVFHIDGNALNNKRNNLGVIPPNVYIEHDDYYEILISHERCETQRVLIDKQDYKDVSAKKWSLKKQHVGNRFYAHSQYLTMHRFIMGSPLGKEIDHIDNDGLNNRRNNLRISTHSQNGMNRKIQINSTTGFKGVYKHSRNGRIKRYSVAVWKSGKKISGGYFEEIKDAAQKYNELAIIHHGEFAHLNKIPNE